MLSRLCNLTPAGWRVEFKFLEKRCMDMEITPLEGGITRIRLQGRLDAAGTDGIGVRFSAATAMAPCRVVVDLSGVGFIASLGMRLLIASARNAKAKLGVMVLYGATDMVQDVLEQMAIDQIMPIVATEALALEAARAPD
jgi:anti-sigma B factor antagonist